MELDQHKRPGIRIKDFFVTFADGDFVLENEDGTLSLAVDIFRIDGNNNLHEVDAKIKDAELESIRPEIEAWVNAALEAAIQDAEKVIKEHEGKQE